MNCRKFHRNLEDYLEAGLDYAGRLGMERHAGECIRCGKELADAERLSRLAGGLTRVRAPENFEAAVCRKIAARKSRGFLSRLRGIGTYGFPAPRTLVLAASGALVLGLGAFHALNEYDARPVLTQSPRVTPADVAPAPPEETIFVAALPAVAEPVALPAAAEAAAAPVSLGATAVTARTAPKMETRTDQARIPRDREIYGMEVMDYLLVGPESYAQPDRLPRKLYVKYGSASEEHFIRNVSH